MKQLVGALLLLAAADASLATPETAQAAELQKAQERLNEKVLEQSFGQQYPEQRVRIQVEEKQITETREKPRD